MSKQRRERRERERDLQKQARERERVAKTLPGASPDRPIEVASASVVEVHAKSLPCPLCGGELRIEEHTAKPIAGEMLRVVHVRCHQCGIPRLLHFRLPQLH